jgi:hypothetical protein
LAVLHTKKVDAEKDAFVAELYHSLPAKADLISGDNKGRIRQLHRAFLSVHIFKHYPAPENSLKSGYFDAVISHLIEAECLIILGFRTAAVTTLRSALEAGLKLLYYEFHPIENMLHQIDNSHTLTSRDYRDFLYMVPELKGLSFLSRSHLEELWNHLCKFVHGDLRSICLMSVVSDTSPATVCPEKEFQELLDLVRSVVKITVSILFRVNNAWLQQVEKVYFDAVLESYSPNERKEIRDALRIA